MSDFRLVFPHQRLDCWPLTLKLARLGRKVADQIPRGYRSQADQLLRSASSVGANLAEGANRWSAGEKRAAFSRARGEAGEVAAHAELLMTLKLVSESDGAELMALSGRVGAILTGLLKRLG